ncbi:MAG TPA: argininosuccinate synthase domain-containing protein [Bacteroidia bacterium]|jgi:argininosuccinate synthase|nr:argininosuccinate synthase domain-containing protein [Bacteroidia bacterium]
MKNNNVILAFSGGLDTTYCALYLKNELKLNVHAVTVDTGGFTEQEKQKLETHAENLGVASFKIINAKQVYYDKIIKHLVFGNVLKNNTYPLSVSAERIIQALAIADYAKLLGAEAIAHGSTGAGNDQVRFDMAFQILLPDAKIITPIRDLKLSRQAEIEYLKKNGVEMNFEKALYSVNKGIWGNSVGGKETLTSHLSLPENAWPTSPSKTDPEKIKLHFEKGELKQINDLEYNSSVEAIEALSSLASPFGIGRDIHVGDTIIGIKGRVGFEAAASLIIIKAHHALEKHVLTKWQLYWKDQLALWYGNWLHEGQYLDPSMRDIEAFFESTQQTVTGDVFVTLMPFRFTIDGITSPHDLMNEQFGSYGEMNKSFTGEDVKGFTKIFGNQTAIYYKVNELQNNLILNPND